MINIFLGEQNAGKTLSMTYYTYRYFKQGYKIYSNFNLNFKHTKITKKIILDWVMAKQQLNNSIISIDELYLMMDSRSFGKASNKLFSYFILQTSKRGVHLFGTAQFLNSIDLRIRDNIKNLVICDRVIKENGKYAEVQNNNRFLENSENLFIKNTFVTRKAYSDAQDITNFYIFAKPVFKLYDTQELIDFSDD